MPPLFDHEKLHVYQDSIRFVEWAGGVLDRCPKTMAVRDQLDRASSSISLNIAEGNGRYTAPDRCRFFDIARGSALECAACLDVLVARKLLAVEETVSGKQMLASIVSMLFGLIKANSPDRLCEEPAEYGAREVASGWEQD